MGLSSSFFIVVEGFNRFWIQPHPSILHLLSFIRTERMERTINWKKKKNDHSSKPPLTLGFLSFSLLILSLSSHPPTQLFCFYYFTHSCVTLCSVTCHVPFPSHRFPRRRKKMMKTLLNFLRRRIKEKKKKIILEFDKRY